MGWACGLGTRALSPPQLGGMWGQRLQTWTQPEEPCDFVSGGSVARAASCLGPSCCLPPSPASPNPWPSRVQLWPGWGGCCPHTSSPSSTMVSHPTSERWSGSGSGDCQPIPCLGSLSPKIPGVRGAFTSGPPPSRVSPGQRGRPFPSPTGQAWFLCQTGNCDYRGVWAAMAPGPARGLGWGGPQRGERRPFFHL